MDRLDEVTPDPSAAAAEPDSVRQAEPSPAEPIESSAAVTPVRPAPRGGQPGRPPGSKSRRRKQKRNPPARTDKPVITPRLSLFVTSGGDFDFERTSEETLGRLRRACSTVEARQKLGLVDATGVPTEARSWGSLTSTLVDAVNAIGAQLAATRWKLTDDQATLLLLRRDPETYRQVTQLSGELLDKYFPGGFGDYDKELSLVVLLGGFFGNAAQQIAASRSTPATVHPFRPAVTQNDVTPPAATGGD